MKKQRKQGPVERALRKALRLIEAGWTKGANARDRWGHVVDVGSPRACRFCGGGAINLALRQGWAPLYARTFLNDQVPASHNRSIISFNDAPETKKADVVALFRRAIAAAKERKL